MKRAFDIDGRACPRCGGRLCLIATVEDPDTIRAILAAVAVSGELADRAPLFVASLDTGPAATLLIVIALWVPYLATKGIGMRQFMELQTVFALVILCGEVGRSALCECAEREDLLRVPRDRDLHGAAGDSRILRSPGPLVG